MRQVSAWRMDCFEQMTNVFRFLSRLTTAIERWLNISSTVLLMILMLSVVADVAYRDTVGKSIPGLYELNELMLVGVVFFAVAYTQSVKGHVRMELVVSHLNGKALLTAELLATIFSLAICVILLSRSIVDAQTTIAMGLYTEGSIEWPFWPARVAVSIGFFFLCIRLVIQAVQYIAQLSSGSEPSAA